MILADWSSIFIDGYYFRFVIPFCSPFFQRARSSFQKPDQKHLGQQEDQGQNQRVFP